MLKQICMLSLIPYCLVLASDVLSYVPAQDQADKLLADSISCFPLTARYYAALLLTAAQFSRARVAKST